MLSTGPNIAGADISTSFPVASKVLLPFGLDIAVDEDAEAFSNKNGT